MSNNPPSQSSTLDDWLCYLERIHPAEIDMGLSRVNQVAEKLALLNTSSQIILIAGTNGKGTTARCLEALLLAQGHSVGTYASPHLLRYNERVRINGKELIDQDHIDAFSFLERGRGEIPLTYFEYSTLGALAIFKRKEVDFVLLEVGLGGRLDATNIVTPVASVITTIDLDHQEYLGDTRELVGYEKAGVFRTNTPAIVGDLTIPHSVIEHGEQINAELCLSKRDFIFSEQTHTFSWQMGQYNYSFAKPAIPAQNAATALTVLAKLQRLPSVEVIKRTLANLVVEGRFQQLSTTPLVFVDVAHNPESATYLAKKLASYQQQGFKIHALIGMLKDKDQASTLNALATVVDTWSLANLTTARGAQSEQLAHILKSQIGQVDAQQYPSVASALDKILPIINAQTLLIIGGSFYTVADALSYWEKERE